MKTIQPRKQHKMLYQAPLHIRYKHFSMPLSPSLKAEHGVNSIPVRTGDTVRIMRGDRKGMEGKVTRVDRQKYRIHVEGVTREKVDGSTTLIPIHPSKAMITSLNLDDKWRRESLKMPEAVKEEEKPTEKPEEKPTEEEKTTEAPKKVKKKRKPRKTTARKAKAKAKVKVGESDIG